MPVTTEDSELIDCEDSEGSDRDHEGDDSDSGDDSDDDVGAGAGRLSSAKAFRTLPPSSNQVCLLSEVMFSTNFPSSAYASGETTQKPTPNHCRGFK